MLITRDIVYLSESERSMLYKFIEREKKKVRKKYKRKIQEDWYDYQEDQIDNLISNENLYFRSLCVLSDQVLSRYH